MDTVSDSPEPGNRPANDSEASRLGDLARQALAARRRRCEISGMADLFGEPAWDILLHLFVAACEGRRLTLAAACSGANVPESTALRWTAILEKRGLIVRESEPQRDLVRLSPPAHAGMANFFRNPGD